MSITIFDRSGNIKAEVSPNDSSVQSKEVQGDNVLTLSFIHHEHVVLDVDDYADFDGERYWMCEKYRPKQKSTQEWEYNIKLYGTESLIRNILVIKRVDGEDNPVFTLTAPPREHVAMIVDCMNDGLGNISDWKVGQVDGSENIVIDYFGKYCDEALHEIAGKVGAEYWVEGQTVNVCRCEHGESITLGYDKGLTVVEPDRADNVKFYTRLYPVGSSRNIDPEKYGYSRLQLPDGQKYVEVNADKYGRVDHYEESAFAEIYPRRIGVVSSVRSVEMTGEDGKPFYVYYFKDDSLTFDPNNYEIGGLVKRVSFQEGSELAGLGAEDNGTYYFEVNFNSNTREFEIITTWPYNNDTQLPGGMLVPNVGDRYILWHLRMPDEYYRLAEAEFMEAVDKYNKEHALDITVFKASTDHVWIEDNNVDLFVGRRVRLESEQYFPEDGFRDSRITGITRKINLPSQMDIEIGDALSRTSKAKINDSIADIRNYARTIKESVSLPDIIRTGDSTRPTDNNLFSARRSLREFVSRKNDDTVEGILRFLKGLMAGDYQAGVSGGFFGLDKDGDSFAEVAKLYVRVKAFFESLTIIEAGVLSGKQYITPGGAIKCTKVEETDSSYRCYFLSEQDGEKTDCKIIAGDQAIAEFFNAKTGTANKVSNHRFWRLVTAVNNDAYTDDNGNHYGYIELSKTDCEGGSSAPVAGDEICQFGNRLDPTRQSAMVFSTVDADAPSVKLFSGINSFSLEGKAVIAFGCDPASGRVFFRLGASGAAHYLEYIQGKGLVVAGKISVKSTFTNNNGEDHSLGDLITGNDVLYISHTSRTSAPALPTVNASGVITSLNGWSTQSPEWQADKYIWHTMYVRKCDGTATFSDPTCVSGKDGKDGTPGAPGADGRTPYLHHAYANSADGVTGFSTTYFTGALYIGICTDYNKPDPTTPSSYEWGRFRGEDGASAKVVVVNSEATAFIYKDDFKTLVGPQSIKLTASLQGTSGYQWSYKTPSMTSFANIAGGTSATYVLSNSFFTEKSCTLRCTSGGVHDEVTIVKVSSGSNGNSYSNNMLTGTQDWSDWVIYNSFAQDGVYKDLVVMHGNSSGITESYIELHKNPLTLEADTVYTMSVWAKGSGKFYTYCYPSVTAKILNIDGVDSTSTATDTKAEHTLTSEWKRYYVVFQTKSGAELTDKHLIAARLSKGNDEIWVAGAKLEKGNNPNPEWSPAASEMVGHDAYTVLLSNESHIFEGDTTKAVAASTSSEVIAYKGATLAAATIGTITGAPTGMTATVQNNGTTSAKFTVAVTTALTTRQGVLTVPVTVDGKAFTQKFSWSLSLKGKDGRNGSDVYSLDLDNEVAGVACNASGAVTGSYPKVTAKVYQGSQPASGVSFSLPTKTGISTATITSAGVVTMSGMTADTAEITVQAVVGGVTLQKIFSLYKVKPGSDGLSYAVNLLKKSNVKLASNIYCIGGYAWDERPAVGTDCTLTVCGKVGPKDNYIELYQNKGYHKIGNFEGRTETVKSFKFKVTEVAGRTTLVDFYRNPDDGDFDSGTYIKWAVITLGDAPQTCWTPAKSEMEGARVFSLQPSTDSVSRNAMGELSTTKVSATKYVTTGNGTTTATEHYLYYRRETASGFSAWTLGAGVGSPTTPLIDILDDTRSVVFELRDSSGLVLDRERVPVISDAADMKVGGTNLLRNSDFIDGLKYWGHNFATGLNAVTIPERSAAIGWFDNRLSAKVSHLENSQTWRKLLQPIEKGRIVPGKTYTLSGFVYIPDKSAMGAAANGSTAYRLRASMCYKLKNDTSNHDDSVIDLMQATEGEWSYMSGRWTAPANMDTEEKVEMTFYLVANGEYYVNGWKLEEGNVPTAWSAAPEDTSYLRSALRENTSIEGGLVAATMLNLGITEENGEFRVTAGMNGSTEVRGDRSIAFWAGGDAIDAEKPGNGTPAKIVMRHDGTAYFCDNTVRLDASRMEIGEEGSNKLVVLDKDGLKLIDGNEQRLRVVHQSVGTLASAVQSTGVTLNATNGIRVRRTRNKEVTTISNSGTTRVVGSFTKNFNIGSGNLPVGATVNITASIYSEFPLINDDMEGFPLLGTNARLQIYERQSGTIIFDKKAPLDYEGDRWKDHWARISANVTIPKAGEYRGNLILEGDGTEGPTYEMTFATATATVGGSVQLGFSDQTVLGNDGLLSKWGETAWLVRSGEVHAKVGTTEFQILPNGIKAIINGKTTWLAQ